MKEEKMLTIMAGAMQDAQGVVNHIWEQSIDSMPILQYLCDLRETKSWSEYSLEVIPYLMALTQAEPYPATSKYIGKAYGKKARMYADLFSVALFTFYTDYLESGLCDNEDGVEADEILDLQEEKA